MEDILQSIRRIIAEDEMPANGSNASPGAASDILELTEMLPDEGTTEGANDVLSKIDTMLAVDKKPEETKPMEAVAPEPAPAVVPEPAPKPVAPPAAKEEPINMSSKTDYESSILSLETTEAVSNALTKLEALEPPMPSISSPVFASGNTVEKMVADMLRPMMKEWLDTNLPVIVERIVEREVRKLIR